MIKSYFKIAWKNLFLNKFHTFINLGGLIIGFTIGIAILLTVYSQLTFDNFHTNKTKLYQAYQVFNKQTGQEFSKEFGLPAAPVFKTEAPAIDKASRFLRGGNQIIYKEKELEIPLTFVDEEFLSMFTFPLVKGSKADALNSLTGIVITE